MSTQLVTKYKNIFAQGYVPHWSQNVFVITKIKNIILRICVIRDFKGAEIVEIFYEKELQKSNQKESRIEKIIKIIKGDELYAKWKDYNNSFNINSWIDKKDTVI